jgi:hypothetical protein
MRISLQTEQIAPALVSGALESLQGCAGRRASSRQQFMFLLIVNFPQNAFVLRLIERRIP